VRVAFDPAEKLVQLTLHLVTKDIRGSLRG
jgi:hypothetical protein